MLAGLTDQFPLLAALVDRRAGGQRRLALGTGVGAGDRGLVPGEPVDATADQVPKTEALPAPPAEEAPPPAESTLPHHVALAVAMALAPLAVEPANAQAFLTAFLTEWGEAADGRRDRRKPRA